MLHRSTRGVGRARFVANLAGYMRVDRLSDCQATRKRPKILDRNSNYVSSTYRSSAFLPTSNCSAGCSIAGSRQRFAPGQESQAEQWGGQQLHKVQENIQGSCHCSTTSQNRSLTFAEKILYSHLDDPHGQEIAPISPPLCYNSTAPRSVTITSISTCLPSGHSIF
jgi:hypothetical protein